MQEYKTVNFFQVREGIASMVQEQDKNKNRKNRVPKQSSWKLRISYQIKIRF